MPASPRAALPLLFGLLGALGGCAGVSAPTCSDRVAILDDEGRELRADEWLRLGSGDVVWHAFWRGGALVAEQERVPARGGVLNIERRFHDDRTEVGMRRYEGGRLAAWSRDADGDGRWEESGEVRRAGGRRVVKTRRRAGESEGEEVTEERYDPAGRLVEIVTRSEGRKVRSEQRVYDEEGRREREVVDEDGGGSPDRVRIWTREELQPGVEERRVVTTRPPRDTPVRIELTRTEREEGRVLTVLEIDDDGDGEVDHRRRSVLAGGQQRTTIDLDGDGDPDRIEVAENAGARRQVRRQRREEGRTVTTLLEVDEEAGTLQTSIVHAHPGVPPALQRRELVVHDEEGRVEEIAEWTATGPGQSREVIRRIQRDLDGRLLGATATGDTSTSLRLVRTGDCEALPSLAHAEWLFELLP